MTSDPFDEGSNSVVVGVVKDLIKTVEDSKQRLAQYEIAASKDRANFQQVIESSIQELKTTNVQSIIQLRKDFNRALQPIMLETLDSRESRIRIQKALDDDGVVRRERQAKLDRQFTIFVVVLSAVVIVVIVLVIVLIIRFVFLARG